jgi:hypothetical protein
MKNVVIGVASIPQRQNCLEQVVSSVIGQCDKINIYLNSYTSRPKFLNHPKIVCYQKEDLGDIGKFYNIENENGYYFTIDDDIIYPSDYVQKMVKLIDNLQRKAIVGVHGCVINTKAMNNYYKDRNLTHYRAALQQNRKVHIIGTGTAAFHTSTIRIKLSDFPKPNMADIWFALLAQQQNVPMILIPRQQLWLKDVPQALQMTSIYSQSKGKGHGAYQTKIIRDYKNWKIV